MTEHLVYLIYCIAAGVALAGVLLLSPLTRTGQRMPLLIAGRIRSLAGSVKAATPWIRIRAQMRREQTDREIFEAISFLRNIISADQGRRISTDSLLEQLSMREGNLRPLFLKSLSLLRVNKKDEMLVYFSEAAGTSMSRDFIRMLIGWDNVSPDKLSSTLLSYQSTMKEMRTTELKRKNEVLSDLVFFPVVTNVLAVFMNFIFISYFIGQRNLLQQLFF
jgi:hypothetical protein